ncbi:MAG: beta-ketoacyl-ACP synthase II [Anaerolineae bacterium]|nr:beta-ketoacyl-ACP synthase II [Anaerolineae bacterium]MCO5203927.1 beta-ketoacyl-ACP synthase II [Anaerolineae bacterium]
MHNGKQRVVITGVGAITPIGIGAEESWQNALKGVSGFGPFTLLSPEGHTLQGLCEIKNFEPEQYMARKEVRRRDRAQQIAVAAAKEAIEHAGLEITDANREQIGIFIGTGIGGATTLEQQAYISRDKGPMRSSPLGVTMIMPNGAGGMISLDHGILGPSATIATACAASNDAIGFALRMLQWGQVDIAVTGGMESIMVSTTIGGFEVARATSQRDANTPSPFDADRDGLVVGEGAGMMVLETLAGAKARGATILAELVGYGATSDAYHITAPPPDGSGAARAISKAMQDARLNADDVSYISAHGTGTPLNDSAETAAIKSALGESAYSIPISSTKSMTGHIMGGTGAIETVFCTQAMRDRVVPPTINYYTPDPECDLDYVPNQPREVDVDVCINNAFGFGGHNAVIILRRFRE